MAEAMESSLEGRFSADEEDELYNSGEEDIDVDVQLTLTADSQASSSSNAAVFSDGEREDDEKFVYKVVPTEQIVKLMIDSINEANGVLQLPPTTLRILLQHFNWDKHKLLEAYFDNPEKVFKDAGVLAPGTQMDIEPGGSQSNGNNNGHDGAQEEELCDICYLEYPLTAIYKMDCGHGACLQCWSDYLTTKIMDEGICQTIACVAFNCSILVDDATVMKLVTDPKVKLKYQHLITENFVHANRLMKWCPQPDCPNVIVADWPDWKPVTCRCGHTFCFGCSNKWHNPLKCHYMKKWLKKCEDDSETSNWIAANTKDCPKCGVQIEKNGGCNYMMCTNKTCKQPFCWICLASWQNGHYQCNRFQEEELKAEQTAKQKILTALKRYQFYHTRYMNHLQSLKFENELYEKIKLKMEDFMKETNHSWIEVQFLKKAVDVLCQCRETLMFTYPFAFYLTKNHQSAIFEDNQSDLERAVEQLSEYLERDISTASIEEIIEKVRNKYIYCDSRRQVMLKHVHEGYDKCIWEYIE